MEVNPVTPQAVERLPLIQRLGFSVGHVFNDLVAAFWFTYLLIYMHSVNQFTSATAGELMLIGQIADGLATPFIGIECDRKLNWWICNYGRRKCWHLVGTICVFISFPFLFNKCIGCSDAPESSQVIYYAAFITVFQFGWAATQISHLSLIPALTPRSSERIELNAWRYAFTVFSNITVYLLMWGILTYNNPSGDTGQIGPKDAITFREVSFIVLAIGAFFSILFHAIIRENNEVEDLQVVSTESDGVPGKKQRPMNWKSWLKQVQFYKVAMLYMGTRLTINLTQVYIPNYVQETLYLPKKSVAYIPLVTYTSGFLSSFLMKWINGKLGKKVTFLLGCMISLTACTWIYFGRDEFYKQYGIFAVSVLLGISSSTMLITSLGITNDLIGKNSASGAFVFGAMSFVDKTSNGIAVMIIEKVKPCTSLSCIICDYYYRDVLAFVCGGSTAIAVVAVALLSAGKIGKLNRSNDSYYTVPAEQTRSRQQPRVIVDASLEELVDGDNVPNERTPILPHS